MTAPVPEPWVPDDSFQNRLGLIRVALGGLNIKEAATLCAISPESWRRWEDGTPPRNLPEVCRKIHRATGLDYRWLMVGGPLEVQNLKFLFALDEPCGQGQLLDGELMPLDFYSRPALVGV